MVFSFIFDAFSAGSIWFKIGLVVFILFFSLLLTWGVFALFGLEELRENRDEIFQIVTKEELNEYNVLAEYSVFDTGKNVYFLDKGIAVSDFDNLRLVLFSDVVILDFVFSLDKILKAEKFPDFIKVPLKTSKKLKFIFGGQSLKVFLPNDDLKKKIVIENLIEMLK